MVPEGALGAFIGENPNGVWTLEVEDVAAADDGSLNGWSLDVTSTGRLPGAARRAPGTTPGTIGLPRAPVCRKVNLTTTILGAKRGARGDVAKIKVKVANKTRNARARAAKAVFALPAGFTLAGKQKGITLKKGKITASFGFIAARKAETMTIKLRAKAPREARPEDQQRGRHGALRLEGQGDEDQAHRRREAELPPTTTRRASRPRRVVRHLRRPARAG